MRKRAAGVAVALTLTAGAAAANDRLPEAWQSPYRIAVREAKAYVKYLLGKVWLKELDALRAEAKRESRRARADQLADDIVDMALPYARQLVEDAVLGTNSTHFRLTLPERHEFAKKAVAIAQPTTGVGAVPPSLIVNPKDPSTGTNLDDRLEQAIAEDLEDATQFEVEARVLLPMVGRPRGREGAVPPQYEKAYRAAARRRVYQQMMWSLRKRSRVTLDRLALTKSHAEIDRARDTGDVWGVATGQSYESWAQNRLALDFQYGRLRWEIHRRRIRRRIDQDLAAATWALAKVVKELRAPETMRAVRSHLERRVRDSVEAGGDGEGRSASADRVPRERWKQELDGVFDRAMARVALPPDLGDLARDHGRRYMYEELEWEIDDIAGRERALWAAIRRVNDKLPGWVSDALAKFDVGKGARGDAAGARARKAIEADVGRKIEREVGDAFREAGREDEMHESDAAKNPVREVRRRLGGVVDEVIIRRLGEKRLEQKE